MLMKKYTYIFILFILIACNKQPEPSLYLELKDISELTLAEVRVEKTFIIDDPDIQFKEIGSRSGIFADAVDWLKRKTSIGKRIGVYSFGTYFSAYLDLSQLTEQDVQLDRQKKQCILILPPIQIKEWGRDFEVKTEHERVSIYRTRLTPEERAKAKDEASKMLAKEIADNSRFKQEFIRKAEDKARNYFSTLLANWDYQADIKFREE